MTLEKGNNDDEIKKHIDQIKDIYYYLLKFIRNSNAKSEEDYNNLLKVIKNRSLLQNKELFYHFILLLINISNDHHRQPGFFDKIERILLKFQDTIKENNTNIEIYEQFESNKRLLYFLIKNKILIVDKKINQLIKDKIDLNLTRYSDFFFLEIANNDNDITNYNNESIAYYLSHLEEYEEKRLIGENDSYICSLIRQDQVEKFIEYVNRKNISLSSKIEPSFFETNSFLIEKNPTLIEYAAFYGSIQIFQYLYLNKVEVSSSLWLYGIHSNNSNFLRNYIEGYAIEPADKTYEIELKECIKCHHNDMVKYIKDNLINKTIKQQIEFDERIFDQILKSNNYPLFPSSFNKTIIKQAADNNELEIIYDLLSQEDEVKEEFFIGNKKLNKIAIPPSIKKICTKSFSKCASLTQISLPQSIISIEKYAFFGCISLNEITIPSSVVSIEDYAFSHCSSLKKISIPSSISSIGEYAFEECESLTEISIPPSVTTIKYSIFSECSSLTTILIPSSVTLIEKYAFDGCTSLMQISIPSSVTSIEAYSFRRCSSLQQIFIPSFITSIEDGTFSECSSIKQITIPSSVTSIGSYAFDGCSSLTRISIPSSVISIGSYAFSECSSLSQISIPSSVTLFKSHIFNRCSSLTQIEIPSFVTLIGDNAFCGCSSITYIKIPPQVKSIEVNAFYGCTSLIQIIIPSSVTSIGNYSFFGCSSLTKISIPSSVKSIGSNAFLDCLSLTQISIPSSLNLNAKKVGLALGVRIMKY